MFILAAFIISLCVTGAYCLAFGFVLRNALLIFVGVNVAVPVLYVAFLLVVSLFYIKPKPMEKWSEVCWRLASIALRGICNYAGLRFCLSGKELLPTDSRFVFVSNHRSAFDPLSVIGYLPEYRITFISKEENMRFPIVGQLGPRIGILGLDRENDRKALKTILTAINYIKKDLCSIAIYPEGTRSKTKELLPFHAGSFKIAQKAGVPVIVAASYGGENVKHNILRRPTDQHVDILECIPADKVREMSTNELADYAKALIEKHLKEVSA